MIRAVIVEDDGEAADLLEGYIKRYAAESGIVFMIDRFDNAITFLENYDVGYDIVFMDIEMEDLDGVSAARLLRKRDRSVTLIFVTNMAQFAIKGYEVDALDFIVKPVKYYDFAFRLKKAVSRLNEKEEQYLPVSIAGGCSKAYRIAYKICGGNEAPHRVSYRGRRLRDIRYSQGGGGQTSGAAFFAV